MKTFCICLQRKLGANDNSQNLFHLAYLNFDFFPSFTLRTRSIGKRPHFFPPTPSNKIIFWLEMYFVGKDMKWNYFSDNKNATIILVALKFAFSKENSLNDLDWIPSSVLQNAVKRSIIATVTHFRTMLG